MASKDEIRGFLISRRVKITPEQAGIPNDGELRRVPGHRSADAAARVTTFELFFDLVFVFAFTQVIRLMVDSHSPVGVLQALVVLGLLYLMWGAYSWLGNQARADQAILRWGMSLAMIGVFVAALTIPEAYEDLTGGWHGPLVLVIAYLAVRLIHAALYLLVSGEDRVLRRQVLITQAVTLPLSGAALTIGAVLGGEAQTWLWLGAFLYELALIEISSRRGGGWRVNSVVHWTERYGLIVILALGESIISIGGGVAREAVDGPIVVGVALAVTLSILLWWSYFARASAAGEAALESRTGVARVMMALNAYTMVHLVIVMGVILTAFGVEQLMDHIGDAEPFGVFGAATLAGGLALFTVATAVFGRMVGLPWSAIRITTGVLVLVAVPGLAAVSPLGVLVIVVALLGGMVTVERFAGRPAV